jgi:hypothetical protein
VIYEHPWPSSSCQPRLISIFVEAAGDAAFATSRDDIGFDPSPVCIINVTETTLGIQVLDLLTRVDLLPSCGRARLGAAAGLVGRSIRTRLGEESAVETRHPTSISSIDGVAHELGSDSTRIAVGHRKPFCESGILVGLPPAWNLLVERPLSVGMLGSLSHRSKVLVLSAQLLKLGREGVVGRAPAEIDEVIAIGLAIGVGEHDGLPSNCC